MNRAVSQRSHVFGGVVLAVALCLPTVVLAQDAPAPTEGPAPAPPPDANAQPAPPPGHYPPPPPRASAPGPGYQYPPQQYPQQYPPSYQYPGYPPPPPNYYPYPPPRVRRSYSAYPQTNGVYRPISFTMGIGPGVIRGPYSDVNGAGKAGLSYNFRLGFGIAPNWQLTLAYEGTGTSTTTPDVYQEDSWLSQNNWLIGLQYFITQRLYIHGAAGLGSTSESSATLYTSTHDGIAVSGGLGFELVQGRIAALGLGLNGSVTSYAHEHWTTGGLDLAVTFF